MYREENFPLDLLSVDGAENAVGKVPETELWRHLEEGNRLNRTFVHVIF